MADPWSATNAEFLPELKALPCNATPLDEALKLKPIGGTVDTFEGYLPHDWCSVVGRGHGGTTVTYIQAAATQYFRHRYPSLSQPDAIHLQIQFIAVVPQGPLVFAFRDIKLGRKFSVVEVEIKAKGRDGKLSTRAVAIVTQGNLATEAGATWENCEKSANAPVPRHLCERWCEEWWMNALQTARQYRLYIPKGGPDRQFKNRFGPGIRETWSKIDDGSAFEVVHLGTLCDPIAAIPISFSNLGDGPKNLFDFKYPTISMSMEVKKDPKGAEWLFTRTVFRPASNGRIGIDVTVMDEGGDIVAVARLMSLNLEDPEAPKLVEKL
ncbi:hypothetical protein G7Y89_g7679 [Cudoniella acicularis]|uniref:Thioesterase-like superfamily-domain-containing protein n=1 Tax=Cudoniella acicularis TaxID=354080 RepID=A0A8H4W3K7_9HELO|nr:hypothetical protein G7Y89_g7679 [Cudoniella acicularis]